LKEGRFKIYFFLTFARENFGQKLEKKEEKYVYYNIPRICNI